MYVKMLKFLHKNGGSEVIDEMHGLVVFKKRPSSNWQLEVSNEAAFEEI